MAKVSFRTLDYISFHLVSFNFPTWVYDILNLKVIVDLEMRKNRLKIQYFVFVLLLKFKK